MDDFEALLIASLDVISDLTGVAIAPPVKAKPGKSVAVTVQGQLGSEDRFSWNGIHQTERTFEKAIDTDIESA